MNTLGWLHNSLYTCIISMMCCKLYVVMLFACCITGFGVGIVVGIVISSLTFGIVIITIMIIVKHRMKGNYNVCTNLLTVITLLQTIV